MPKEKGRGKPDFAAEMRALRSSAPARKRKMAEAQARKLVDEICEKCRKAVREQVDRGTLNWTSVTIYPPMVTEQLVPESALLKRIVRRLRKDGLKVTLKHGYGMEGVSNIRHVRLTVRF